MSFQAYLDTIEEKTGKAPIEFLAEAKQKQLTEFKEIIAWLKNDYGLGLGHARALAYVIRHGPEFEVRQTTGPHRDASGTLKLDGRPRKADNRTPGDLPGLAAPARRALAAAGVQRLEQLAKFREEEVKTWHGIGPNALGQLRRALAEKGLSFAGKGDSRS